MTEYLSTEVTTFSSQARPQEYLVAGNLFDDELLVITISRTVRSMATTYAHFLERKFSGDYTLINVTKDDRTFYCNVALFLFSGLTC
jgi:hypothetical protein